MTIRTSSIVAIIATASITVPAGGASARPPTKQASQTRQKIEKNTLQLARHQAQTRQAEMRLVGRLGAGR
jgi:hypothetical protein